MINNIQNIDKQMRALSLPVQVCVLLPPRSGPKQEKIAGTVSITKVRR